MAIPSKKEAKDFIAKYPTIEAFIEANGSFTKVYHVTTKVISFEDTLYYNLCKAVVNENKCKKSLVVTN